MPRLVHLTTSSQQSILECFAQTATVLEHLRKFTSCVLTQAASRSTRRLPHPIHHVGHYDRITKTVEAFSDALDCQIREFDQWCANKEEELCIATAGVGQPVIFSLLRLEKELKDMFSKTFEVLLHVLERVMRQASRPQDADAEVWMLAELPARIAPSAITTLLLDSLLQAAQEQQTMGDSITSDALLRIFVQAVEPLWAMIGRWLKDGMPIQDLAERYQLSSLAGLDDEFFIEINDLTLLDPDFWAEGYVLRDSTDTIQNVKTVPTFLSHIALNILSAGKGIGLLRILDIPIASAGAKASWISDWLSFSAFVKRFSPADRLPISSVDYLSRLIYDELLSSCQIAQRKLAEAIVQECSMWQHLTAMENLYLMRRGDAMSHFSDVLFAKVSVWLFSWRQTLTMT